MRPRLHEITLVYGALNSYDPWDVHGTKCQMAKIWSKNLTVYVRTSQLSRILNEPPDIADMDLFFPKIVHNVV